MGFTSPAEGVPRARSAALKAVELDDTLADAHYALAIVYTWADWNWPAAEREFRRAIQLNPGFADAHAYYAHLLNILHRELAAQERANLRLEATKKLAQARSLRLEQETRDKAEAAARRKAEREAAKRRAVEEAA